MDGQDGRDKRIFDFRFAIDRQKSANRKSQIKNPVPPVHPCEFLFCNSRAEYTGGI
jgi:hypothetical protein